jgi:uncharacterized SAM-binding protein YcdF (DUF218 family)
VLVGFGGLGVGNVAYTIAGYAGESYGGPADAAVVLGAAVWDDEPSPVFRERLNHALNLYAEGRVETLIFTGGVGIGQPNEAAEAEVARKYALAGGVSETAILTETASHTTGQNLAGAQRLAEEHGLERLLIVSDPLHMKRAVTMARDLGMDAHPSPTPTTRYRSFRPKALFLLRETYFYLSYLLRR